MGAVSALLYSSTYYKERVVALCLDSPFKDLTFLCDELMIGYNVSKKPLKHLFTIRIEREWEGSYIFFIYIH